MPNYNGCLNTCQQDKLNYTLGRLTVRKRHTAKFANNVRRAGDLDYFHKLIGCGDRLTLKGEAIVAGFFCKSKFCGVCQWRRSRLLYNQNMLVYKELCSDYRFVFLTLTIPNVPIEGLKSGLDLMQAAWDGLRHDRQFKSIGVAGMMRTIEITYNEQRNDYHPHYHVILVVPDDGSTWLPDWDWWLQKWRQHTGISDIWAVNIKAIKSAAAQLKDSERNQLAAQGLKNAAVLEVSKYNMKGSDLSKIPLDENSWRLLQVALHRRRMVSFTGIWKKLRKELNLSDPDKADLLDKVEGNDNNPLIDVEYNHIWQLYSVAGVTTYDGSVEYSGGDLFLIE